MKKTKKPKLPLMKGIAAVLAGVSFFTGFFFLDRGVTGNVILNGDVPAFSIISLIGLFLVFFSAVLAFYVLKR